ncbi:Mce family protein [Mycobacteroides abscessus subsp. bolletii]|uniref:MlaD family protein n=1 Tax=Mycobacteroides abscessus TaxID=36809 RepID=UPI00092616D2|nr:MlaD family protein [Mycobacteroides abscessus]SHX53075.1 Mce family protein [Mycobacteroides abscessus subsp. bolletii]SKP62066.1 Mce family protein [Mycobacteroides abscessus subsp. bolletii]SKP73788.1 Mce family protein [Mycobacteroides abscessus subsp. bolletii]SKQ21078.1 Mce family protein [Mycobacteroides abscessus subsp. bolletii]
MKRVVRLSIVCGISAVLLIACAALDVDKLPAVNQSSGGYNITIEFANVLNLPNRAKVVMDGTKVGEVENVSLAGTQVNVTTRINSGVEVPTTVHAVLQQATVLGDIYVALDRSPDDQQPVPVKPNGVIPIAQTDSPPQLEDTIASLANFIASGSIQRAQNSVIGINRISPLPENIRRISSQAATDLADLSGEMDTVDQWLDGVGQTAHVLASSTPLFQQWFSDRGQVVFDRGTRASEYIATLLPSVGSIYSGGFWLVPMLDSVGDAAGAIQRSKWAVEDEIPKWRRWFTDYFLPQDKYPAMNITSIVGPDGRELSGNVHDVLRILGAVQ